MSQQNSASLNRLVIEVDDGQVKNVYTERNSPVKIGVVYKHPGTGNITTTKIHVLDDGGHFTGDFVDARLVPDKVKAVFTAFDFPTSSDKVRELRYLNDYGDACPVCNSSDLRMENPRGIDNDTCVCNVECLGCQSTWTNSYKLDGYEDLSSDVVSMGDGGFVVDINIAPERVCLYQTIIIEGVTERLSHDAFGICEVDNENPAFFSVYLRDYEGISQCFGDCGKNKLPVLRQLAKALADEHGWVLLDHTIKYNP